MSDLYAYIILVEHSKEHCSSSEIAYTGSATMKHPVQGDFDTALSEAGVTVAFKPTNSIYSFYRLAGSDDIARIGPVSPQRVQHEGPSGDTGDYASDEVQAMPQQIASEAAASVWSVQDEAQADKLTTAGPVAVVGDRGD
jgi:hypothetical protein